MDLHFWPAIHQNHISSLQSTRLINYSGMEEEEGGAWFPCPFCYVEIEVPLLCVHLHQDHCFDFKNAVCPICAANLGKDALSHFTLQHSHSIKTRRKCQKSARTNSIITELNSFLDDNSSPEPAPDPLLSPFLCTMVSPISEDSGEDMVQPFADYAESCILASPSEDHGERKQRAAFVRELLWTTIF